MCSNRMVAPHVTALAGFSAPGQRRDKSLLHHNGFMQPSLSRQISVCRKLFPQNREVQPLRFCWNRNWWKVLGWKVFTKRLRKGLVLFCFFFKCSRCKRPLGVKTWRPLLRAQLKFPPVLAQSEEPQAAFRLLAPRTACARPFKHVSRRRSDFSGRWETLQHGFGKQANVPSLVSSIAFYP